MRELTSKEIKEYENLTSNAKQMSLSDFLEPGGGKSKY